MATERLWRFYRRADHGEEVTTLWLYPELDCSACVGDFYNQDGQAQLAYYIEYLRSGYSKWLEDDAVPIAWSVRGDPG